jgi:cytochrome P450
MEGLHRKYGSIIAVDSVLPPLKARTQVLAVGPVYNRIVLGETDVFHTGPITPPGPRGSAVRRLRKGIVSINGEEHAYYRKLLLAPLRRKRIDELLPQINAIVHDELDRWPLGQRVNLWELCRALMQKIAIGVLFAQESADRQIFALAEIINAYFRASTSLLARGFPVNLPGTPFHRQNRLGERMEDMIEALARQRAGSQGESDLFALLVNATDQYGQKQSVQNIVAHIPQLFGASYETCQTALLWTLVLLTQFPGAYRCLAYDTIAEGTAEGEDYLDCIIKESMRLLPPVPFQRRIVWEPNALLGIELRRGANVYLSIFLTNRDASVFHQPHAFMPERWIRERPAQYEFTTFSAGPRTCIGAWFAMAALRSAIAAITRRFRIMIVPGTCIDPYVSISMSPRRAVPVILCPSGEPPLVSSIRGEISRLLRSDQPCLAFGDQAR